MKNLWTEHKFIAIGEIGIDLYWDKTFIKEQIIAFRRQIAFAIGKELPVVIHSRDSFPEVFSVLDEFKGTGLKVFFMLLQELSMMLKEQSEWDLSLESEVL